MILLYFIKIDFVQRIIFDHIGILLHKHKLLIQIRHLEVKSSNIRILMYRRALEDKEETEWGLLVSLGVRKNRDKDDGEVVWLWEPGSHSRVPKNFFCLSLNFWALDLSEKDLEMNQNCIFTGLSLSPNYLYISLCDIRIFQKNKCFQKTQNILRNKITRKGLFSLNLLKPLYASMWQSRGICPLLEKLEHHVN